MEYIFTIKKLVETGRVLVQFYNFNKFFINFQVFFQRTL